MSQLLLIEDDELVGTMIRMNLEAEGHDILWCRDGDEGLRRGIDGHHDLILLDISLPGMDGLQILGRLRKGDVGTPVLMITARSDVDSKVRALDAGADDYLPKPFELAELVARVRALVRRSTADREIPSSQLVTFDEFEVNLDTRVATTSGGEVILSEKEAAILGMLVRGGGQTVTRTAILEEVWGMDAFPVERTVDNYLLRLRKIFEVDPAHPRRLLTVRGEGFRFVP